MPAKEKPVRILIADDDESVLTALETILEEQDRFETTTCQSGAEALQALEDGAFHVALLDLTLDDHDGLEILRNARSSHIPTEIILVTGHGSIGTAVEAMRSGAYDYLTKPVDSTELLRIVNHASDRARLVRENQTLQQQVASLTRYQDLFGKAPVMQELFRTIAAVAGSDASVLITGESGTGKELVAHAIHKKSARRRAPFIAVNCAALPANIFESELFGHEKGAFTGAVKEKAGFFEQADGGTLFLDELTEMPLELQAKMLRALETSRFRRVGGTREQEVDVRVLAATNRDPHGAVEEKKLRDDVYYRLAVVEIELPALRERVEDIPLLASEFLSRFGGVADKADLKIGQEALEILMNYAWPGNVRELRNAIERAVILTRGATIMPRDLPPRLRQPTGAIPDEQHDIPAHLVAMPVGTTVADMERELIMRTLDMCHNNKTRTAEVLKISLKTLHNKLTKYANEARSED